MKELFSKPKKPAAENRYGTSTKDESQILTPLKLGSTNGKKGKTETPQGIEVGQQPVDRLLRILKKSRNAPLPTNTNIVDLTTTPKKSQGDLVALAHPMTIANEKDVEVENALYFIIRGKGMSEMKVKFVLKKLQEANKDIKIHTRFCKSKLPKFLVLDYDLKVASVSEVLGFTSTLEMASLLLGKVHFVSPLWTQNHAASIMDPDTLPSANEIWSGQLTLLQLLKKRPRENNNSSNLQKGWVKKLHKPNELAPMDATPTSRTSDELITKMQQKSGARAEATVVQETNNAKLANMLNTISKLYKEAPALKGDKWRSYSYNIASGRVRTLDFELSLGTLHKLKKVKGVGDKVYAQAREFLETGNIAFINQFEKDELLLRMRAMTKIWGVGQSTARDMAIGYGLRNISDVRKALENGQLQLTEGQKVGVEFYEDFQEKMTIYEVQRIAKIVKDKAKAFYPDIELEIMGSYRRGKTQCGDADLLLIHKEYKDTIPEGFLDMLVERLRVEGHISHHLTKVDTKYYHDSQDFHPNMFLHNPNSEIYMGVFNSPAVPGMHRRIDIKFHPYKEKIFAMISFTGNGFFNRAIRLHATRNKDWKLSEKGLFYNTKGLGRSMNANTEKEVFDKLGIVWKEPTERDGFHACIIKETNTPFDSVSEKDTYSFAGLDADEFTYSKIMD